MKFTTILICVLLNTKGSFQRVWVTSDDFENHISPEDLREFYRFYYGNSTTTPRSNDDYADIEESSLHRPVPDLVDCFGAGSVSQTFLNFVNMRPDDPKTVNTHFYFSSRLQPKRVQVYPGDQFGLEWVDFKPSRKTVMIVHGFMSHSNASWVTDMARAFLEWGDVNVIAVDWSGGGNTWKYWRAVANTRRVGSDIVRFLKQLMHATGANVKDFHFIGHSLGAHIASYASAHCGRVARITGLDPAQPCFATSNDEERLDRTDADYVDIIHTNGQLLQKFGFGMPDPVVAWAVSTSVSLLVTTAHATEPKRRGHSDFYPNGGLKQPGCLNTTIDLLARLPYSPYKLQQAICSHGRAYVLFTESLINNNCSFRAYRWDLTYEGINKSLKSSCDRVGSCAEMGIKAIGETRSRKAHGAYILLTTDKEPYCVSQKDRRFPLLSWLYDLKNGLFKRKTDASTTLDPYADPLFEGRSDEATTTERGWWSRLFS